MYYGNCGGGGGSRTTFTRSVSQSWRDFHAQMRACLRFDKAARRRRRPAFFPLCGGVCISFVSNRRGGVGEGFPPPKVRFHQKRRISKRIRSRVPMQGLLSPPSPSPLPKLANGIREIFPAKPNLIASQISYALGIPIMWRLANYAAFSNTCDNRYFLYTFSIRRSPGDKSGETRLVGSIYV